MNKDDDIKLSRRRLLQSALVLGATAPLLLSRQALAGGAQMTKQVAQYQDQPKGDKDCSKCRFFQKPKDGEKMGTCQIVQGKISPRGYCMLYAAAGQ